MPSQVTWFAAYPGEGSALLPWTRHGSASNHWSQLMLQFSLGLHLHQGCLGVNQGAGLSPMYHQPSPRRCNRIEFIIALESLLVNLDCSKAWLGLLSSWPQSTLWWPVFGKEPKTSWLHLMACGDEGRGSAGPTLVPMMPRAKRKICWNRFWKGREDVNKMLISKTKLYITFLLHIFY